MAVQYQFWDKVIQVAHSIEGMDGFDLHSQDAESRAKFAESLRSANVDALALIDYVVSHHEALRKELES